MGNMVLCVGLKLCVAPLLVSNQVRTTRECVRPSSEHSLTLLTAAITFIDGFQRLGSMGGAKEICDTFLLILFIRVGGFTLARYE